MTTPKLPLLASRIVRSVLSLLIASTTLAYAQTPGQMPLLIKNGAGVLPNIMLTLDDSGSMAFRHMPEDKFASDTFATPNPVNSNTVRWDPSDNYQTGTNFRGTVPGDLVSGNFVLRALRSPDTNTIFYNPEIRYQPWLNDDGVTRRPNSPITTAYLSPPLKATTATSVTPLTIGLGSKTFTLTQTGKAFTGGQFVVISSNASALAATTNWMYGSVAAFNAGTGSITVNVTKTGGGGTLTSWNVVQTTGTTYVDLTQITPTGTFTAGSFLAGYQYKIVSAGSTSFVAIGAANNNVGTVFTALGRGSGSGTASGAGSLTGWCYSMAANTTNTGTGVGGGCQTPSTGSFNHDPGVYFRLTKTGSVYNAVGTAANYTPFTINFVPAGSFVVGRQYTIVTQGSTSFMSIGAGSNMVGTTFTATGVGSGTGTASHVFTKYPNRSDCLGFSTCTRDEERQNFANWYTYYRDRNLLARGSLMEAFGPDATTYTAGSIVAGQKYSIVSTGTTSFTAIGAADDNPGTIFTATGAGTGTGTASGSTFRLGFGRINKGLAGVDGVGTAVIESDTATYGGGGIRDYNAARRINLFKWLEDLPASGGTPLVEAMQAVGVYYKRTDTRGPWTDDPSIANVVTTNKTCRRSYNIMTTDGYWNGPGVAVGNADNTAGLPIAGVGSTYTYTPSRPYLDGSSNTLADVAMYYWKTDLQPAMVNAVPPVGDNISFWQNMTNFTVGLGVRGTLDPATDLPALVTGAKTWPAAASGQTAPNVDDLWHAAVNSRGKYFSVKDPQELSNAIKSVLASAAGTGTPTAGVATASTVLQDGNRKYVPTFQMTSWSGDISARLLDATGQVTTTAWNAAARMPAQSAPGVLPYTSARNIVTWDTGSGAPIAVPFKWTSLSPGNQTALTQPSTANATFPAQFIDFLWGDHTNEGTGLPFRDRIDSTTGLPFILGDFVNSNPVLVLSNFNGLYTTLGLGTSGSASNPDYSGFLAYKAARTSMLFAGGNDGMLHAFKDTKSSTGPNSLTDGQEVFAYVPRAVYPNLYKLGEKTYGAPGALEHQFFVDGPLREADAYVKAAGAGSATWRNYLMGSLGAGGRAVFALDVTDLANLGLNTVRWEISNTDDSDLGYVLSPIKVGVLPNGRWVAVFGNGFSSDGGYAKLFVVDIENAASSNSATRASAIQKVTVGPAGANGLGGVTLIHDANGQISTIYAGDLNGKMWKFVYDSSAAAKFTVSDTNGLFTATDSVGTVQPITSSPAVYNHAQGGQILVFGTGKLFVTTDATDTSMQTAYAIWDKPADSASHPMSRSMLASRTLYSFAGTGSASGTTFYGLSGTAVDWTTQRGWYMDLGSSIPGGRVVYPAQVVGFDTALISTVAPVQGTPAACDSLSGNGLNLLLPVQSGLNPGNHDFDTTGNGLADSSDAYAVGYSTAADGIDAVVRTQGTNGGDILGDKGGGGGEGDCTGATCSATGNPCVYSPLCPEPNTCLASVQSATAGVAVCIGTGAPTTQPASTRTYDRVWRRIINPPIR